VGALESGSVLACQFHPELSGEYGDRLIARWLEGRELSPRDDGPARRVIPCLDVRDGRIVKGVRFADLRDAGSPAERASLYEAQGADEIVVLDVSAGADGRLAQLDTVRDVRARLRIPLTVGGGVRALDDVQRLLEAGADKVAINTAAVLEPSLVDAISDRFGRQCAVVAIDAAMTAPGEWQVVTHAGTRRTGKDAVRWAQEVAARGAGEILLTSFDRDGTRSGYDLELVRAVTRAVPVPVVASGGAANPEHLALALEAGADAVLAASIFHDEDTSVAAVKDALAKRGVKVRP
jgi:imidazoleglycerol phosphate synthase cyclase subunit